MDKKYHRKMYTMLDRLAKENKKGFPFSACVEINKKLYFAVNEVISKNDPTAHAEIQAIRYACNREKIFDLTKAKIYCSGEPCPMCLTAIAWAGVKEIYYIHPYTDAIENNYYYDRPSKEVNRFLNLKRKIRKL